MKGKDVNVQSANRDWTRLARAGSPHYVDHDTHTLTLCQITCHFLLKDASEVECG